MVLIHRRHGSRPSGYFLWYAIRFIRMNTHCLSGPPPSLSLSDKKIFLQFREQHKDISCYLIKKTRMLYNKQSIATEQWVDSAPNDADLSVIASVHGEVLYSELQTTGVRRPIALGYSWLMSPWLIKWLTPSVFSHRVPHRGPCSAQCE